MESDTRSWCLPAVHGVLRTPADAVECLACIQQPRVILTGWTESFQPQNHWQYSDEQVIIAVVSSWFISYLVIIFLAHQHKAAGLKILWSNCNCEERLVSVEGNHIPMVEVMESHGLFSVTTMIHWPICWTSSIASLFHALTVSTATAKRMYVLSNLSYF